MTVGRFRTEIIAVLLGIIPATVAWGELPAQDWVRTETRADCASYNPLRTPFFGETHIHTSFSGDAVFVRVRSTPREAYMFAQGAQIGLPPYDAMDQPTRFAQLHRPLDFTAVTDHAEWLRATTMTTAMISEPRSAARPPGSMHPCRPSSSRFS